MPSNKLRALLAVSLFLFSLSLSLSAQTNRAQYPPFLSDSYFGVNIGAINYPFSNLHLETGYQAESVTVPHTAVGLVLYGRQFNDYLSMQINYMRPVLWVVYRNVNGAQTRNSVWMNVAGLTVKPQLPVNKRLSVFGEFGLSIITRHGFHINQQTVVKDANYASVLIGGGLKYRVNKSWDLLLHGVYSPANNKAKQPHTVFFAPGFQYNMKPLADDKVLVNSSTGYIWPRHQVMLGYTTNAFGYGVNAFFSQGAIPVFWGGDLHVESGLSINYQRNVFHGRKIFSLDFGASASYWKTENQNSEFFTLAIYPVLRFTFLRTKPADFYFFYSVAGPTYISKAEIDGIDTGKRFTFHDYMGIGTFAGPLRNVLAEIKIGHYSNGNLFSQNAGVKVPLTFAVGYTF
jgi:hypothetical protein